MTHPAAAAHSDVRFINQVLTDLLRMAAERLVLHRHVS
jgi:hypothetical protein